MIARGSRRATLCRADQREARRALRCNKIQVTGSGANTEARAARSRVAVVGPSECRSCLLACHCLPTFLATYLHQMLVGPVDCSNCPFGDISKETHSWADKSNTNYIAVLLGGQTRSCLILQEIPCRQIMAGVIEMFGLAVSVKAEAFESASTCGQAGLYPACP